MAGDIDSDAKISVELVSEEIAHIIKDCANDEDKKAQVEIALASRLAFIENCKKYGSTDHMSKQEAFVQTCQDYLESRVPEVPKAAISAATLEK